MKKVVKFEGVDCAHCASQLEVALSKIEKIRNVSVNFMAMKMIFECNDEDYTDAIKEIKEVTRKKLPECKYLGI